MPGHSVNSLLQHMQWAYANVQNYLFDVSDIISEVMKERVRESSLFVFDSPSFILMHQQSLEVGKYSGLHFVFLCLHNPDIFLCGLYGWTTRFSLPPDFVN